MALLAVALTCCLFLSDPVVPTPAVDASVVELEPGRFLCRVAVRTKRDAPAFTARTVTLTVENAAQDIWVQRRLGEEIRYVFTCRMNGESRATITLRINGFSSRWRIGIGFGRSFQLQRQAERPVRLHVRLQPPRDAVEDYQP
jgi:hypothetical protein